MVRISKFLLLAAISMSKMVFAETIPVKPTVIKEAVLPKASFVFAITSTENKSSMLTGTQPQLGNLSWLQVENGRIVSNRQVPVPPRVPVAIDEKRIAWATNLDKGTSIHLLQPQTEQSQTFDIALAGITHLAIVGSDLFAISAQGTHPMHLHHISLVDGKVRYLSQVSPERSAISFGQSVTGRLILIDNAEGRFREDNTEPYTAGIWKRIDAPILDSARKDLVIGLGPNIVRSLILQHWLTKAGTHGFVVTVQSKLRGQYAIETNAEGKELRQWQIEKWMSKASEFGHLTNHPFTTYAGLASLQWTGDLVTYEALR